MQRTRETADGLPALVDASSGGALGDERFGPSADAQVEAETSKSGFGEEEEVFPLGL